MREINVRGPVHSKLSDGPHRQRVLVSTSVECKYFHWYVTTHHTPHTPHNTPHTTHTHTHSTLLCHLRSRLVCGLGLWTDTRLLPPSAIICHQSTSTRRFDSFSFTIIVKVSVNRYYTIDSLARGLTTKINPSRCI
jgi:hypothetical protein